MNLGGHSEHVSAAYCSLISIVPFSTGDIFSSVRFSLYRTSEYRAARHLASSCETPGSIGGGACAKAETDNIIARRTDRKLIMKLAAKLA
jgi:hypothetical protein